VVSGTIDAICSAHEPHEADALLTPLACTPAGVSAIELMWPLLVQLHSELNLSWCQCLNLVTSAPARILRLNRGHLAVGKQADLTLLSPTEAWKVRADTLVSQGKNTPFLGQEVNGEVMATYVQGRAVYKK
ncbi:MAG: amidohydrolase family protein, partial [Gammaproteobacteria bacterium]|nr:amidohydrolase family protein [Gammaproteobacteria bacterium]